MLCSYESCWLCACETSELGGAGLSMPKMPKASDGGDRSVAGLYDLYDLCCANEAGRRGTETCGLAYRH